MRNDSFKNTFYNAAAQVIWAGFAALFVLKLCGIVSLSWIWIFTPLWIIPAVVLFIVLAELLITVIVSFVIGIIELIGKFGEWVLRR